MNKLRTTDTQIMGAVAEVKRSGNFKLPRPKLFVNRENELAMIVRVLDPSAPNTILVYGLGGVGKTTIAIEAAYIVVNKLKYYERTIFLSAKKNYWDIERQGRTEIRRGGKYRFGTFNGLLYSLGLILNSPKLRAKTSESPEENRLNRLNELKKILQQEKVVFIIDNLDAVPATDMTHFEELIHGGFIPDGNKVILTARTIPNISALISIKLDDLKNSEDINFLIATLTHNNEVGRAISLHDHKEIIDATKGNPLIIEQLIALSATHKYKEVLNIIHKLQLGAEGMVDTLFTYTIKQLSRESKLVLEALAKHRPLPIIDELTESTKISKQAIKDAISELRRYSLIYQLGEYYDIHPLLQRTLINK